MPRARRLFVMLCLTAGSPFLPAAEDAIRLGVQIAVVVPTSPDLKLTTGSSAAGMGLHLDLPVGHGWILRPRMDCSAFSQGQQHAQDATFDQRMSTKVSSLGIGVDVLTTLPWLSRTARIGLSIQDLRWRVASVNTLQVAAKGRTELSGTSTWWRFAWGPVLAVRVSDRVEVDARLSLSRYGQEDQPAHAASLGLLWHF